MIMSSIIWCVMDRDFFFFFAIDRYIKDNVKRFDYPSPKSSEIFPWKNTSTFPPTEYECVPDGTKH